MGMLSSAKVVTSSERGSRPRTNQSRNREFVTVIQGVCATCWTLPLYIVVKGKFHVIPWYRSGRFPSDWRIHTSTNGWTTNDIGLDSIKRAELKDLRTANEVLSKRRRAKKTRLEAGGSLSMREAKELIAEKDVSEQLKDETSRSSSRAEGAQVRARHCSVCGVAGHNARTCQVLVVTSEE